MKNNKYNIRIKRDDELNTYTYQIGDHYCRIT